jgi:hypothetical protein
VVASHRSSHGCVGSESSIDQRIDRELFVYVDSYPVVGSRREGIGAPSKACVPPNLAVKPSGVTDESGLPLSRS